jgi:hypothetical protein
LKESVDAGRMEGWNVGILGSEAKYNYEFHSSFHYSTIPIFEGSLLII